MSPRSNWCYVVGSLIALEAGGACSAAQDEETSTSTTSGAGAEPGVGGSGATPGQGGTGQGVGGFCATSTCSEDFVHVLDCDGNVVATCPAEQMCDAGKCIDPCGEAAAGKSSYGCDFWALKIDNSGLGAGYCFAAFIANTGQSPVRIEVDYGGTSLTTESFAAIPKGQGQGLYYEPYDSNAGLPVGEVAILFLVNGLGLPCPSSTAISDEASVTGTGRGQAFHIRTDRPVAAYQINPYGGGDTAMTSSTLLLPTSVWDTNYIAVNPYEVSPELFEGNMPSLDLLALEDDTNVTILPKVAVVGGVDVAAGPANQPITYTLQRGQYVQIAQAEELTGSPIESDKPIAVFGAANCLFVPKNVNACDSLHQQLPPIRALGSEYVAVRHKGRHGGVDESEPWRLVGAVDGTVLTWWPSQPPGAPATLELGTLAEFDAPGPFIVRSQDEDHPFYVGSYMSGADTFGEFTYEGDPEWVNVVPPGQYLTSYVFFTDPTYSETSLTVVRKADDDGSFADVTLDCAGVLGGWMVLDGGYQYTRVDLVTGDFENVGGCSNGRHEMSSSLPFTVTVWGWTTPAASIDKYYVSYGYPAGLSVESINDVDVPPVPK